MKKYIFLRSTMNMESLSADFCLQTGAIDRPDLRRALINEHCGYLNIFETSDGQLYTAMESESGIPSGHSEYLDLDLAETHDYYDVMPLSESDLDLAPITINGVVTWERGFHESQRTGPSV